MDGIALDFPGVGVGHQDHYYHYLWGYLFPALDLIQRHGVDGPVFFRSCGPVMDARTKDAARAFGIDFRIRHRLPKVETWQVARLDVRIMAAAYPTLDDPANPIASMLQDGWAERAPSLHRDLTDPDCIAALPGTLRDLRERLRRPLLAADRAPSVAPYMIIERSAPHPHYAIRTGQKRPDYGQGRRALRGIRPTVRTLRDEGHPVGLIDCAQHSLSAQAHAFSLAKGIAMIRGAEVANLIWAPEGTPVLILNSKGMVDAPPHVMLAKAAGLRLTVDDVPTRRPVLDTDRVRTVWGMPKSGGWLRRSLTRK